MMTRQAAKAVLLGLSGYEPGSERIEWARRHLEARGYQVKVSPALAKSVLRFAASDADRIAAFNDAMAQSAGDLIMAYRGGYGLSRILSRLDFGIARSAIERGACLIGHSDFTALSLALLACENAVTFSGPMAGPDFGVESPDPFMEAHFWPVIESKGRNQQVVRFQSAGHDGHALKGTLWGGNLMMVCSLLGTPFFPDVQGGLLFVEDINEHPYRIERCLLQLLDAGVLERQSALVLGDVTGYRTTDYDRGYDMDEVARYIEDRAGIPVVSGLPYGHGPRKVTLPVGGYGELVLSEGAATLSMSWAAPAAIDQGEREARSDRLR